MLDSVADGGANTIADFCLHPVDLSREVSDFLLECLHLSLNLCLDFLLDHGHEVVFHGLAQLGERVCGDGGGGANVWLVVAISAATVTSRGVAATATASASGAVTGAGVLACGDDCLLGV